MQAASQQDKSRAAGGGTGKLPSHELVYRRIREMILFGEMAPGQAVTIQGLVEQLDAGMTPVREALRRLTAEGALEFLGNRRISVPELTPGQLDEIAFVRQSVEPRLAYLAASRIKPADIERLRAIDDELNIAIDQGDVGAYLKHNCQFHQALYAHAGARILMQVANALWLRVGPSLRVVCGRYGTANLPDMHDEALAALRAGDADGVAAAIAEDIQQGHAQIRRSMQQPLQADCD